MSEVVIRRPTLEDARNVLELVRAAEAQTPWLLSEMEELEATPGMMMSRLAHFRATPASTVLVAEIDGELVGYVFALGGHLSGLSHLTRINGLAVLEGHRGTGVAGHLLDGLESWARKKRLARIELKVMAPNESAIRLYEGRGYEREGLQRRAYRVDGEFVDAVLMAKLL